ncbi:pilus assembly protein [Paraburkholderia silviterrae]|uniref:Pilus assembly protein n=2 Tax=Paraburkholderia silviterrae TaxID=2528715 RepID=A0A4R5LY73_9BURK|nr:pilus assembly protein [Paraburkholderia silviterrae]
MGGAHLRPGRGRRAQRGVAALEFALVLPMLLLILFGIMETGFFLYDKAVITNASRAAARQAVAFGEDSTGAAVYMSAASATSVATSGLSSMLISPSPASGASVTVTPSGGCTASGQALTIAVSYPFTGLGFGSYVDPLAALSSSKHVLTLNASTTMNCE